MCASTLLTMIGNTYQYTIINNSLSYFQGKVELKIGIGKRHLYSCLFVVIYCKSVLIHKVKLYHILYFNNIISLYSMNATTC